MHPRLLLAVPLLTALLSGLFTACTSRDTKPGNQFTQTIRDNDFFALRTFLENEGGKLSSKEFLYFCAISRSKFDRCEISNRHIERLFSEYSNALTEAEIIELLKIKADNHVRLYQYRDAEETYAALLERYRTTRNKEELADIQNAQALFDCLADVPPQRMAIHYDVTIPAYKNQFNHQMIPVEINGTAADFILDSGANISTISESYAQKMNLRVFEKSIQVGGSTSFKAEGKLAVADRISIGGLSFENVIFLVISDQHLNFPQVGLVINGVIGFPVLHQMAEIRINKDGTITVPRIPEDRNLNNLFLDGLTPVVSLYEKDTRLLFNFDTGANSSILSKKYYDAHQAEIEGRGTMISRKTGGLGGIVEKEEYELPDFEFTIGSKQAHLPYVSVAIDDRLFLKNKDGNLGQDVILQFDRLILNFKYMYIDFDTVP